MSTELSNEEIIKQGLTQENIEKLIVLNKGLVFDNINSLHRRDDDMTLAVGYEALYKAILSYKPEYKVKFSTYAYKCVFNAIATHIRRETSNKETFTISLDSFYDDGYDGDKTDIAKDTVDVCEECVALDSVDVIMRHAESLTHAPMSDLCRKVVTAWVDSKFELTGAELADMFGCTRAAVTLHLQWFRKELKIRLDKEWSC